VQEGRSHFSRKTRKLSEPISESLRMALVITLHHKYIQLSGSNHTLPIHSRIGVVLSLGLGLYNYSEMHICKFLKNAIRIASWTTAAKLL